jgi:hypothetical protein
VDSRLSTLEAVSTQKAGKGWLTAIAANASGDGSFKAVVETARQMVSKAAGVSPDAVRIMIQFGM